MDIKVTAGAILLVLVSAVIFKEWFILILGVGLALILIIILLRLLADLYWYCRDKGV
jgi:hypothetical protein